MPRMIPRTETNVLDEAATAFAGMDEFVDALPILISDDGKATVEQMVCELRARAARYPRNPVVQSTAAGLENAYRFAIAQRLIDCRLMTNRSPSPDVTSKETEHT